MPTEIFVENTANRYTQKITSGNHTLYADEPESMKGNDKGSSTFRFTAFCFR